MISKATTVKEYLASLAADRRAAIQAVREVILGSLGKGYEEGMQYGMIGYFVPRSLYPPGYHCDPKQPLPFAGLAAQKNHLAIYLMCTYGDSHLAQWFRTEWAKTGKKLDMGKSCIRFKQLDDLPLDLIGRAIARIPVQSYIAHYESTIAKGKAKKTPPRPAPKKKVAKQAPRKTK